MLEQNLPSGNVLHVKIEEFDKLIGVLRGLNSEPRLRILRLLSNQVCNVRQISAALNLPASTTVMHLKALEHTGLIRSELRTGIRGLQKICIRVYDSVFIDLLVGNLPPEQSVEVSIPIGTYINFQVTPTCGLVSEEGIIGMFDHPASFYEPDRIHAQLLWFRQGFVEYHFPNRLPPKAIADSLNLSLELCSEAPLHHNNWPSDVTFWINQVEIGTWTSPADFGGEHGMLTPRWWDNKNTQYGLLKMWKVNPEGSFIDGVKASDVRLQDLDIVGKDHIIVRIGVKEDARHVGGVNIFGSRFGNYPQDIVLRLHYRYDSEINGRSSKLLRVIPSSSRSDL